MALDGIGSTSTPATGASTLPASTALTDLAGTIAALRATDPAAAATAQRSAEANLTPVERGRLAAAIDARAATPAWRQAFDAAMAAPGAVAAFQAGVRDGLYEGARSFVVGTAELVGRTVQLGADVGPAGWLGDRLRGVTGDLPAGLDAVVPSNARGNRTIEGLGETATAIRDYALSRARDPSLLVSDTSGVIERNWDALRAGHAAAAARGPEAEARWWGEVTGRAVFEIGASFVPVAGVAGRAGTAARNADRAADTLRAADTATDIARPAATAARREIVIDGGRRGEWPTALNARNLEANATYRVNGYTYQTDAAGRVTRAEGTLDLQTADRNRYQQRVAGRADRLPADEGGHLFASIFNGPGDRLNLVPMDGNFNRVAWRALESRWADAIRDGRTVEVQIDVVYRGAGQRPAGFVVRHTTDGVQTVDQFRNVAGGR